MRIARHVGKASHLSLQGNRALRHLEFEFSAANGLHSFPAIGGRIVEAAHPHPVLYQAVEVDVVGTEEVCSELLTRLIQNGYRILEFRPRQADLEQIFMNVTKGDVA